MNDLVNQTRNRYKYRSSYTIYYKQTLLKIQSLSSLSIWKAKSLFKVSTLPINVAAKPPSYQVHEKNNPQNLKKIFEGRK